MPLIKVAPGQKVKATVANNNWIWAGRMAFTSFYPMDIAGAYAVQDLGETTKPWGNYFGQIFGAWDFTKVIATDYLAASDLIVVAYSDGTNAPQILGYTDAASTPTTLICFDRSNPSFAASITMPVRKGDYWRIEGTGDGTQKVSVLPIGAS